MIFLWFVLCEKAPQQQATFPVWKYRTALKKKKRALEKFMGNREVYPNLCRRLKSWHYYIPFLMWKHSVEDHLLVVTTSNYTQKKTSWIFAAHRSSNEIMSAALSRQNNLHSWVRTITLTSKWRFEWLRQDAFLSPVCRPCCRLVNRSGDKCDCDSWLRRKTNTLCYSVVEYWIRLLLSPLPLPPLMVPGCLQYMAKCWLLDVNVCHLPQTE